MKKRLFALLLAVVMLVGALAACGQAETPVSTPTPQTPDSPPDSPPDAPDTPAGPYATREPFVKPAVADDVPRNETLWFNGFQWGSSNGWNPISNEMNNPLAIQQDPDGARLVMMETPYMYNMLNNTMIPLIADGDYSWNADGTELSYKIKKAALWSDATKITAHDAAFSWEFGTKYSRDGNANWTPYIADVVAQDDETVVIKAVLVDHNGAQVAANPLMMITYLGQNYINQKAWLEALIDRNGGDISAMYADPGEDVVFSGPYAPYFMDDVRTILVRDDGYWGQHADMWGQLPVPKYIANVNYETNAAGDSAIAAGDVDVSQQFIMNVNLLWEEQDLPISTYLPDAPWFIAANMPTAYFNLNSPAVGIDNPAVRKAIAIATDYDLILANAMTNQSPSFADYPRSLMNPTAPEQAMYDQSAVSHLQWTGNDIDGANQLLDDAGILRNPGNGGPNGGWREIDGEILSFKVSCPEGWSDWQMAMEIVAAAGPDIGIQLETYYIGWDIYQTIHTAGHQTELDIFMFSTQGISPAQPWSRIRALLSSEFNGLDGNWTGNFGQYNNDRVDELIKSIPLEKDAAKLKEIYTELVEIYLTDVPSFSLMYRPEKFHTVNESIWTGFTNANDGRNVPPVNCTVGYAIADLYNLRLVG